MYASKTLSILALCALLVFTLAACGGEATEGSEATHENMPMDDTAEQHEHMTNRGHTAAGDAVHAEMHDGVQMVEMEARTSGYRPKQIQLEAGVPARLVITRTTQSSCLKQINIPQYGIEGRDLPMNEPVTIEFTPDETGTFTFVCGMDMQRGTMMVRS